VIAAPSAGAPMLEVRPLSERAATADRCSLPNCIEKPIEDDARAPFGSDAASKRQKD
jgi:hypothetical protein